MQKFNIAFWEFYKYESLNYSTKYQVFKGGIFSEAILKSKWLLKTLKLQENYQKYV